MNTNIETMGRAKTVLVFGQGEQAQAVLSAMVVHPGPAGPQRLRFTGPVAFADAVRDHMAAILLPIVDRTCAELQVAQRNFEISAVNLAAASVHDLGVQVSGFSADVPVLLALLSSGLQIAIAQDVVTTGHIASTEGDIRTVRAINVKVKAAKEDPQIRRFIYPDPDSDNSLTALSPRERQRCLEALGAAAQDLHIQAVGHIGQLVRSIFTEEAIVLASLQQGFYNRPLYSAAAACPIEQVLYFLTHDNRQRFWKSLEQFLLAGQSPSAQELLAAFAQLHVDRCEYPPELGERLRQLVCSLPPVVRRLPATFPLLATGVCIRLSQFAAETDYTDVCELFAAAHGRLAGREACSPPTAAPVPETAESDCPAFDAVVAQINQQALARKFGIPIDSARGSYVLESSAIDSYDQFADTIEAFYVHLQRYLSPDAVVTIDPGKTRVDALDLLERTFQRQGGLRAAYAQAVAGTDGGLRGILDALTEQYQHEVQTQHVQYVFKETLDSLNWDERVRFMQAVLRRLGPMLPADIQSQPAERFAHHYDLIIQAYVQSTDKVHQLLRTL